jgi:CelD/BcsL family acetyltransferase involved in cellulose biosynthesis
MQVDIITELQELDSLEPAWNELLGRSGSRNFFLTFEWFRTCWSHLADGGRMCVAVAGRAGKVLGIAPLRIKFKEGFRHLGFMGPADYQDFIIAPECRSQTLETILQALQYHPGWDIFELARIPSDAPNFLQLQLAASKIKGMHEIRPTYIAPYIRIETSWDAYWRSLSKNLRSDSRRRLKKLEAEMGGVSFRILDDREEISTNLNVLMNQHIARRDARDYSLFRSPAYRSFYTALAEAFSITGALSIAAMQVGGRTAALSLGFTYGGKYLDLAPSFDEALAKYSIGRLLMAYTIEQSFKANLDEFDLGAGAELYKFEWKPKIRQLYTVTLCPVRPRSRLAHFWFNHIRPKLDANVHARALRFALLRAGIGKR